MKKVILLILFWSFNVVILFAGQRPNIYSFTSAERTQLRNLMMNYITPTVVQEHGNSMDDAHTYQMSFLTWHRDYIGGLENYLRNNGGSQFVPLPAWNPGTSIPLEFRGSIAGLTGTNIDVSPEGFNFSRFSNSNSLCSYSAGNPNYCTNISSPQPIDAFAHDLECEHDIVHVDVGGVMANIMQAPSAAIFWLYHAYIDDFYYDYDANCNCNSQQLWQWDYSSRFGWGFLVPDNWVYTSHYNWIYLPPGQNTCAVGQYFYGTICGITGWFYDSNYGDGWIYSYLQGSWLQCAGKNSILIADQCPNVDIEEILTYSQELRTPDLQEYSEFKNEVIEEFIGDTSLDIDQLSVSAYPNPLNSYTILTFSVPEDSYVSMSLYDLQGREVTQIVDGEKLNGQHEIRLDASSLKSGVYYVKIQTGTSIVSQKLIVTN